MYHIFQLILFEITFTRIECPNKNSMLYQVKSHKNVNLLRVKSNAALTFDIHVYVRCFLKSNLHLLNIYL